MQFPPPVIGITTSTQHQTGNFFLPRLYVDALRSAGGSPILLPPGEPEPATILDRLDGLVFSGGGDIEPCIYNGSSHPTIYSVDPERDRFELHLARLALAKDIPVLGICRGLEVLLVATGGDLVPHVPDEFGEVVIHRAEQSRAIEHSVQIVAGSRLATLLESRQIKVFSWHHQAAKTVPSEWRITAQAADGVIEALEHQFHPWAIALQWHPELSRHDPLQQRIFKAFVTAAQNRQRAATQIN